MPEIIIESPMQVILFFMVLLAVFSLFYAIENRLIDTDVITTYEIKRGNKIVLSKIVEHYKIY
jgi:hypothetical protein